MDLYKAYWEGFFVPRCIWNCKNWRATACFIKKFVPPPVINFWLRAWQLFKFRGYRWFS